MTIGKDFHSQIWMFHLGRTI